MENLDKSKENYVAILLGIAIFSVIVAVVVLASVPPVSRDALTHHLAIPKLYLKHGGIYEIPGIIFSYYPMNLDLLYLIPLYFQNDIAAKYIHFLFALLTALFIYKFFFLIFSCRTFLALDNCDFDVFSDISSISPISL